MIIRKKLKMITFEILYLEVFFSRQTHLIDYTIHGRVASEQWSQIFDRMLSTAMKSKAEKAT